MTKPEVKQGPGRPPVKDWPDPIPDTPDNVLRSVLSTPALRRDQWDYMKANKKSEPNGDE